MIKDGRPLTIENGYTDAELITDQPKRNKEIALTWIKSNIKPRKTPLIDDGNSYQLKHILEWDTGLYLTNNAFKDAMLLSGYKPVDPNEINWHWRISKKSFALKYSLDDERRKTEWKKVIASKKLNKKEKNK